MSFPRNIFREPKAASKETEVYNTDEREALTAWCYEKFRDTGDLTFLIPPFSFEIGARVGETTTFRWEDLSGRYIRIHRTQRTNKRTGEVLIQDHAKAYSNRKLPISTRALEILDIVREKGGDAYPWIFTKNGQRVTERQANYILEKYAKTTANVVKSSHKLRKTCGSDLFRKGFSVKQCADYLGNSPEVFMRNYLFDTATDDELIAILDS